MKNLLFFIAITDLFYGLVLATPVKYNTENDSLQIPDYISGKINQEDSINEDNFGTIVSKNEMIVNEYWLFTRKNPTTPQTIVEGDVYSILNSNYDASKPLKVIAHGWNMDAHAMSSTMVKFAYLETSDVNIILLDWRVAASGNYFSAALRIPATGRALGNFLQWFLSNAGGNWNSLHLIGYSFGAHVMGTAGRVLRGQSKRVTGLDPAGPFWSGNSHALNTAAGQYVEVIHTNIMVRGITEPIGHTDFYPNGGHSQPGCGSDSTCSHARSYKFFASSVRTNHFIAKRCSNLLQAIQNICYGSELNMGNGDLDKNGISMHPGEGYRLLYIPENLRISARNLAGDHRVRGIYALTTGSSWPF